VGSIDRDFGSLEEDDIYIALVSKDLLRIKLVRRQDQASPAPPVKGWPRILKHLRNLFNSSKAQFKDEQSKKLVQVIPLYLNRKDWPC
jgi:hypothetical protein